MKGEGEKDKEGNDIERAWKEKEVNKKRRMIIRTEVMKEMRSE